MASQGYHGDQHHAGKDETLSPVLLGQVYPQGHQQEDHGKGPCGGKPSKQWESHQHEPDSQDGLGAVGQDGQRPSQPHEGTELAEGQEIEFEAFEYVPRPRLPQ